MMAYLKGADNRRDASFAVQPGERVKDAPAPEPEEVEE